MGNQRIAYGKRLVELGRENENIVACEADLGKSTMSYLFQEEFPDRYFEMGIGEQNMASFAAGISLTGKIPFIHSFSAFLVGRAYEQIRVSIAIGRFNVKIIGSSYGLSDFGDGATHQSIEDISLMRTLPNMTVFAPLDAYETVKMLDEALRIDGPVYMRINRNDMPDYLDGLVDKRKSFFTEMRRGDDIVIFSHGIMVSKALEAAHILEENFRISARVVNVSCLKPIDESMIKEFSANTKVVVVAEEHSVINGLGSIVEHALRKEATPVEIIGVNDRFGQSAHSYEELLVEYGLTSESIVSVVKESIK